MLKIGFKCFWTHGDIDEFKYQSFFEALDKYDIEYREVDPCFEECHFILIGVFENFGQYIDKIKGNPILISVRTEPMGWFYNNERFCNFSIDFNKDSEHSLYQPLFMSYLYEYYEHRTRTPIELNSKTSFCSFLATNGNTPKRNDVFRYITNNYKKIDSLGPCMNNTGFILPRGDFHYPKRYKFNLCFENSESGDDYMYITEKIIRAYAYDSIPVYCGNHNVTRFFNQDSFIDCNGLTNEEIVERIREVDSDDEKYLSMVNATPFKDSINYKQYMHERLINFLDKILYSEKSISIYDFKL